MTKADKRRFIRSLVDSIRREALAKVDLMPEDWDGHELRQYLADKFAFETTRMLRENRRRWRNYRNTVASTSL
jgi:hypothetical protein